MNYKIFLQRSAVQSIKNIDKQDINVIKQEVQRLSENPRPFGVSSLRAKRLIESESVSIE